MPPAGGAAAGDLLGIKRRTEQDQYEGEAMEGKKNRQAVLTDEKKCKRKGGRGLQWVGGNADKVLKKECTLFPNRK